MTTVCFLFISRSGFISRCYTSSQRTLFSNLKLTIHSLPENAFYAYFMYSNISQYCSYLTYFNNLLWINKEEQENIKS